MTIINNSSSLVSLETAVEEFIDYGSTNAVETWWATQSGQALDDLASLLNSSSTNPILLGYSGQKVGDTVTEITTDIGDIFSTLAKGANQTWDLFSGNYNLPTNYDSVTTASDGSSFVVNFPTGGTNPDGSAFQGARLTFSGANLDPTNPYNANYTISQTQLDILKTPGDYTDIAQSFTVDSNVVVSNQVLQASTLNGFTFTYGSDFIAELTGDVNISTTELTAPASRFEIRVGDNVALDPTAATDARLYLDGSFSYNLNTDTISSHFSSLGAEIGDISLTVSDLDSTLTDIKNFSPSTWLKDLLASNPTVDMAFNPSASHGMADGTISASASINGTLAYNDLSKDITWNNAGLNINYQNTDATANLTSAIITASATDVLSYNVNTQQASGLITGSYSSTGDTSNTRSGKIAIDLAGTNHAPSDITLDNLSVAENSAGAHVANITGTDPDGDALTYSIVGGADAALFEISASGDMLHLATGVSADYETDSQLEVQLQATDPSGFTYQELFTINVSDNTSPSLNALETAVEEFIDYGSTDAVETWWATQSGQALDDLASLLNSSSTNPILLGYSGQKVGDTVTEITTDIGDIFSTLAKGANQTWDLFSGNYNLPTNYDSVTTASDGSSFVVNFPTGGTNPDGSAFQGARLTFSGANLDPTNPYNANYTITQTQLDILKTPGNHTDIAQSFTVDSNVVVSNQVLQASTLNGFTFTYGSDFIAELTGDVNISTTDLTAPASRFEIRVGDNVALDPTAATDARLYLDGSFSYNLNSDSISSHFSSLGAEIGDISLTVSDLDSTLTDIKNFSPSTWLKDLLASNPTMDMAFNPSASHSMSDGTISAGASISGTLAYNDLSKDITWTSAGLNINYQNTDATANLVSATITASATDVLSYNVNTQQATGLIIGSYSSTGDTSNTRSGNIAIDLAGTNHAPTDITLDNLSVAENSAGAHVGNIAGTDPDGDALTYTIVGGVDSAMFEISASGDMLHLATGVSADYEADNQLDVQLQATDAGGLSYPKLFTVNVTTSTIIKLIQVRNASTLTAAQASIEINGSDFSGGLSDPVVKFDLYFDAEGIDLLNSSATGILGAEFTLDFDVSQLDSVSAFASDVNADWLMDVVFESNVFAASTSNNVTGSFALGSSTAIVDIDPGNDTGRNTVLLEQKIGTVYVNPKEDLDSIELMITDMDIATDIGSVQPLNYGVSLDATMIDALIKVDETHYLNNMTINYFKDGADTAISTLVEDGGIKIEESIDFDAVKLSDSSAYTPDIKIGDAIDILRHIVDITPLDSTSSQFHAADVNNDGEVKIGDAIDVLRHIVDIKKIDTFDLIDAQGARVTQLDPDASDDAPTWTLVANGDVDLSGSFAEDYVVAVDMV